MITDTRRPQSTILIALVALLVATLACGIGTSQATKPAVVIASPQAGNSFTIGQEVIVQSVATDAKGISRMELWVDGQPVHTQAVAPPVTSYTASQPWTPAIVGSHAIEVRAYNVDNNSSDPAQIIVTVTEASVEVTPEPGDTSVVPTPTGTPPSPTTTPTATTPTTTDQTTSEGATVTALIGLNIRTGPGAEYPVIGGLPAGQSSQITGKNPEGTWWQIIYPSNSDGRGWISASDKYSAAKNTEGVPVVEVPPLPTDIPTSTATPTATPTSTPTATATSSATPQPPKPVIYSFTADRYTINAGESVTLHWDLANAQAAYLRYDGVEEGVVAPGHKTLSPATTTVYTLAARNEAGETTAQLTINVNPAVAQYDLYVRRMDFTPPDAVEGEMISLNVMIATDISPSGGPFFPASYFRWRQGPGFAWQEEYCPADNHYAQCSKTLIFSYPQQGTYEVEVEADSRAEILETNESNNAKSWAIVVSAAPGGLTAPIQIFPPNGAVFDYYPRTTTLEWTFVPGAATYVVEIEYYDTMWRPWQQVTGIVATNHTFDFIGAQPGRWRVWAVDASNNPGPATGWWEFTYLR